MKTKQYLTVNLKNSGRSAKEMESLDKHLARATKQITRLRTANEQGFMDLPYDQEAVRVIQKMAAQFRKRFENMIVIGVGGSDLGTRAIYQALGHGSDGLKLFFTGNNTDPDSLSELLNKIDFKKTAINVVSKSGTTIETMSAFLIIREALIRKVGKKKHTEHIIVTTDLTDGVLEKIAKREGYQTLAHPLNVGGRFAVLSSVGLFPAACAGISISRILKGAQSVENEHQGRGPRSAPARFAATHYLAYQKSDQDIHICMPYCDRLQQFGFWFRQLWAESLGKSDNIGPTPIAALGATDQHSQLQLYLDGPKNKLISIIQCEKFDTNLIVPKTYEIDQINYFQGKSLSILNQAELMATIQALNKRNVANILLTIPKISPESLGALFMFYELACAYLGELFLINTYDQPGVQLEKTAVKHILAKK
ncbi:MAG: glucose-6-phosphate isomerase [Candidatus Uhrbacteria bacterium]